MIESGTVKTILIESYRILVCHEGGLYLSVEFLNQPIGLRMVGRCSNPLRAKYRDEICKERRLKRFSSVCRYRGGYTEYGHATFHGKASCHRENWSTHVSMHIKPFDYGRGSAISTWTWSKRQSGIAKADFKDWVCLPTFDVWQAGQFRAHYATSFWIRGRK